MRLLLLLSLFPVVAFGQNGAVSSVETDKAEYAYGETIELRYTVKNEGNEAFELWGASFGCQAEFIFDDFDSREHYLCTADDRPYTFSPGASGTWTWHIRPGTLGLPESSGTHTITAFWDQETVLPASTTIEAPEYLGGRVDFKLTGSNTLDDIQDVLDALNAVEVQDELNGPLWEISGTTLEEATAQYENDPRFASFSPVRIVTYANAFFTDDEDAAPSTVAKLTTAHPNPFTTSTSFTLTVPQAGLARVEVFDVLGRRVATLHDGPLTAGVEHRFTFAASNLPSGLYVVRAIGSEFSQTRRVMLSR